MHFQVLALAGFLLQRRGVNYTHPHLYSVALTTFFFAFLPLMDLIHRKIEKPFIRLGYMITGHDRRTFAEVQPTSKSQTASTLEAVGRHAA